MIHEVMYLVMICMIQENMVMDTEHEDMIQMDREAMMVAHTQELLELMMLVHTKDIVNVMMMSYRKVVEFHILENWFI